MSFIKRLFSSPQAVEDTFKSAVRGLDSVVYTDQEKAEKTQTAQNIYARLWEAAVPSALSRRLIACVIAFVWATLALTAVAQHAFGNGTSAEFTLEVLKEIVLQPMNIVVGFYFLKQIVTEYRNGKEA